MRIKGRCRPDDEANRRRVAIEEIKRRIKEIGGDLGLDGPAQLNAKMVHYFKDNANLVHLHPDVIRAIRDDEIYWSHGGWWVLCDDLPSLAQLAAFAIRALASPYGEVVINGEKVVTGRTG